MHFFWQFAETCDVTICKILNSFRKSNIRCKLLWNRVKQLAQMFRKESMQTGISKDRQNHENGTETTSLPLARMNRRGLQSGFLVRNISCNWTPLLESSSFAFLQSAHPSAVKTVTLPIAGELGESVQFQVCKERDETVMLPHPRLGTRLNTHPRKHYDLTPPPSS